MNDVALPVGCNENKMTQQVATLARLLKGFTVGQNVASTTGISAIRFFQTVSLKASVIGFLEMVTVSPERISHVHYGGDVHSSRRTTIGAR